MVLTQRTIIDQIETWIATGNQDARDDLEQYLRSIVMLPDEDVVRILAGGHLAHCSKAVIRVLLEFYKDKLADQYPACRRFFADAVGDIDNPYQPRKDKYLSTLDIHAFYKAKKLFSDTFPNVESKYHKDLAEATQEEIIDGLTAMRNVRHTTLSNYLVALRKYVTWCKKQGYPVPHYDSICAISPQDIDIDHGFSGKIVKNPAELASLLRNFSAKCPRACVAAVCAWIGFFPQEIVALRDADVKPPSIQTSFFGEVIVPDELVPYLTSYRTSTMESGSQVVPSQYYMKARTAHTIDTTGMLSVASVSAWMRPLRHIRQAGDDTDYNLTWEGLRTAGAMWRLRQKNRQRVLTEDDYWYEARAKTKTFATFRKLRRIYLMYLHTYG